MLDQAHKLRELALIDRRNKLGSSSRRARRIAVTSGKGGVGKSNFALNIAILCAALKKNTLLIDADTNLANIDILLGISPKFNLSHVLAGQKECREIIVQGPGGISILPASSGSIEQALDDGIASDSIIYDLNSLENDYDLVIFDTGAGVSKAVLDFILIADTMVLVTTPEPTAVTDAYAMVKLITVDRPEIDIQIMVNMASDKQEAVEVFDKLSSVIMHFLNTEVRFLGYLPKDSSVERAVHLQSPLVNSFPKSPSATQLKFIARKLIQPGFEPPDKPAGFLGSIFNRIKKR